MGTYRRLTSGSELVYELMSRYPILQFSPGFPSSILDARLKLAAAVQARIKCGEHASVRLS